jgi:hypothetical protein
MKIYEKVINIIAGVGFLALVPVGLAIFHVYGPLDWLEARLGFWGSATFLLIVFYALTVLRILFGHAELYAPLVMGVLTSFVVMCAAIPVSFMTWYWNLVQQVAPLAHTQINFLAALLIVGLATLLSSLKRFPMVAEILILIVLPIGAIVTLHYLGFADLETLLRLPPAQAT